MSPLLSVHEIVAPVDDEATCEIIILILLSELPVGSFGVQDVIASTIVTKNRAKKPNLFFIIWLGIIIFLLIVQSYLVFTKFAKF